MKRITAPIAVVSMFAMLTAQERGGRPPDLRSEDASRGREERLVTVRGCLRGSPAGSARLNLELPYGEWVGVDVPTDTIGVVDLALEGQRDILRMLREQHWGHLVEITGLVIIADEGTRPLQPPIEPKRPVPGIESRKGPSAVAPRKARLKLQVFHNEADTCNAAAVRRR